MRDAAALEGAAQSGDDAFVAEEPRKRHVRSAPRRSGLGSPLTEYLWKFPRAFASRCAPRQSIELSPREFAGKAGRTYPPHPANGGCSLPECHVASPAMNARDLSFPR